MKCDLCGERTAVVFLQLTPEADATSGEPGIASVNDLYLCEECAKKRGLSAGSETGERSLGGLFSEILDVSAVSEAKGSACPTCGMTSRDLRKRLCAGCPDCYSHFRAEIVSSLRREGIEISYKGPLPAKPESFSPRKADPDRLRMDLKKALEREDYELAAYYRDRIMALGERP